MESDLRIDSHVIKEITIYAPILVSHLLEHRYL